MNIEYQQILELILIWGYPLMLLLMIVEGPIVTLGAAFLASMGYFNFSIVLILSILGDIIGDIILYFIGFSSQKNSFFKKRAFSQSNSQIVNSIKENFQKKGAQIIFFTKITTGLCYITFILAGMLRLNFKKFLLFSFLGGIIWSSFLVAIGYYFGHLAEKIEEYIKFSGWIIFAVVILSAIIVTIYKKTAIIEKYKLLKK